MHGLLDKRDPWGHGWALWVLAAMAFTVPLAGWAVSRIQLDTDVEHWLPTDDVQAKSLEWYRTQFPDEDRLIVTWDSSSLHDPRLTELAHRLRGAVDQQGVTRGNVKQVAKVYTPHELIARMHEQGVAADEAARRLQGVLIGKGPLHLRWQDAARPKAGVLTGELVGHVQLTTGVTLNVKRADDVALALAVTQANHPARPAAAQKVAADTDAVDESDEAATDVVAETASPTTPAKLAVRPYDLQLSWRRMHLDAPLTAKVLAAIQEFRGGATAAAPLVAETFYSPGSPSAISLSLNDAGRADLAGTMDAIRAAAVAVGIPEGEVRFGGRDVCSAALNAEIRRCIWNPAAPWYMPHQRSILTVSAMIGVLLAFFLLRSAKLAMIVLIIANYATLMTLALVPMTDGMMNMVLVVMPTLLSVITLSGAIHVANYWTHTAQDDLSTAVSRSIKMAWMPCFLACLTTAIGLLTLMTSPLRPIREFGIYSAAGCLISFLAVVYGLPAILQYIKTPPTRNTTPETSLWGAWGRFVAGRPLATLAICSLVMVGGAIGLSQLKSEIRIIRYFPEAARVVQDYEYLEANLSGTTPVELVIRFDEDAQTELGFLQRLEVVRQVQEQLRLHPDVSGSLSLADFRPVVHPPEGKVRFRDRMKYKKQSEEIEERLKEGKLSGSESFYAVAGCAVDAYETGDAGLCREGDELWRITAQIPLLSDRDESTLTGELEDAARSVLKLHPGTNHVLTGMVPVFLRMQEAMLSSMGSSFGLAFALIALVFMLRLRHPVSGLLAMIPNVLPVATVFGIIGWSGMTIDVGTMITASVALGIAVDSTLHLLTWFQEGLRRGMTRGEATARALAHCGPAMWQTSAVIACGMLMLAPAELILISRFGWLMAALIAATLLGGTVLLPALMGGWLGQLVERSVQQAAPAPTPVGPRVFAGDREDELAEAPSSDSIPSLLDIAAAGGEHGLQPHLSLYNPQAQPFRAE